MVHFNGASTTSLLPNRSGTIRYGRRLNAYLKRHYGLLYLSILKVQEIYYIFKNSKE